MNACTLTTDDLIVGCSKPIEAGVEFTMPVVLMPSGSYLSGGLGNINGKLQMALSTCTPHMSVWTLSVMKATRLLSGQVGNDAAQMNLALS